jgi:zinc protease
MHRPRPTIFMLATLTTVVAVSGFSPTISAQLPPPGIDAPSTKGMVRKNKVPVSSEILKIKLPKAAESDLKNGLHLIVLEDRRLPQISFQLFIPGAGGYYDPADRPGLATFTAALMREGTSTRTSNEISRQLEVMAASLAVGAGVSSTEATLTGSSLSDQFDRLLDLAADVLLHPSFPDDELARYKQRTRSGFAQQRSNPGFLAGEMFSRAIYGTHPAGRVSPSVDALNKTTREALVDFHKTRYVPDRAALAIAGDISMAESRALVEAKLGGWAKAGIPGVAVSDPQPTSGAGIYFIARPNSVQTNLIVGTQAIERTNPDFDVLSVMNKVIGGGPTGRLFLHLREDKGYTYGAYSTLMAPVHRGAWQAATNVRTEVTEPALNDLLAEIRRLRDEPVPEEELNDAKRSMVAEYALELESPTQLLNLTVNGWRFKLPPDYWDRRAERLLAVTSAEVQAAARKYLAPDRLQIVAVGDPARVAESLKKLGTIQTYDIEGKRAF